MYFMIKTGKAAAEIRSGFSILEMVVAFTQKIYHLTMERVGILSLLF
jgi:hypothetical protein